MNNPFSTASLLKSASNYPVAKGDLPGHEFHGNQYITLGNGEIRPVHETTGEPTMTGDNPLHMVSEGEITPAETQKYFGGREHHGYFVGQPDGNVNPLTGEISGGAKQSVGYDKSEVHAIVQGNRSSSGRGSIFTRVIRIGDGEMKIGDTTNFAKNYSDPGNGFGEVIGIADPNTGRAYGYVPNRRLSYWEPR